MFDFPGYVLSYLAPAGSHLLSYLAPARFWSASSYGHSPSDFGTDPGLMLPSLTAVAFARARSWPGVQHIWGFKKQTRRSAEARTS